MGQRSPNCIISMNILILLIKAMQCEKFKKSLELSLDVLCKKMDDNLGFKKHMLVNSIFVVEYTC